MLLLLWMVVAQWAISSLLFLRRREFTLSIGGEPITVANSCSEVAHAAASNNGLIEWWLHGLLECFPASMRLITELAVVWLKLHVFWLPFHAYWFCWFWFVLWRSFNVVDVLLFAFLQYLTELLSKHVLSTSTKLSCVTCSIIKWFLLH